MNAGSFELSVAVPSARGSTKIREYGHQGRTFVEGRKGQPFSILFRNNSAERVLAVPSVDGISVMDGQPATEQSRGYIVSAYSSIEIKGWRTSLKDVAQFFFETKDGSYAATGPVADARNCGVIGCRVVGEKPRPVTVIKHVHHYPVRPYIVRRYDPWWFDETIYWSEMPGEGTGVSTTYTTNTSQVAGESGQPQVSCFFNQVGEVKAASLSPEPETMKYSGDVRRGLTLAPDFNLGTGYGTHLQDNVSEVHFDRGTTLALLDIFYSDADGLRAAGIDLDKGAAISLPVGGLPQSFNGFCQPPR